MAIHDEDQARPPSGTMALVSLLTGIVAVFACGLGLIAGPVAVVLGVMSGRRSGFGGRQIGGIATGALGFLVSAGALIGFLVYASGSEDATPTQTPVMTEVRALAVHPSDALIWN